jgi:hypothetical protein
MVWLGDSSPSNAAKALRIGFTIASHRRDLGEMPTTFKTRGSIVEIAALESVL